MVRLVVVETTLKEEDLFLKLVDRGRYADIPYYFSVRDYDWKKGIVLFERLDCCPAPAFKVGVAGKCLVVSEKDYKYVADWLDNWKIRFKIRNTKDCIAPEEAMAYLVNLRQKMPWARGKRQRAGIRVHRKIRKLHEARDKELLATWAPT